MVSMTNMFEGGNVSVWESVVGRGGVEEGSKESKLLSGLVRSSEEGHTILVTQDLHLLGSIFIQCSFACFFLSKTGSQ